MKQSQLVAFHAVMTSPSLSAAAKRLGRSQPAVTVAIKALEDELGLKLFERDGGKLVPVPEAQYLLAEAEEMLSRLARVRQTMRNLVEVEAGHVHVATMQSPAAMLFPRFIAGMIAERPGCRVSMFAGSTSEITEQVRAQSIDFAFTDDPGERDNAGIYSVETIVADCSILLPPGHRLSEEKRVSVAQLDGEPMGLLLDNHVQRAGVRALFQAAGAALNVVVESRTSLSVAQFVVCGQCAAIVDPLTTAHFLEPGAGADGGAIVVRPLVETLPYRYALITPRYRPMSLMAKTFRAAWRDEVFRLLDGISANPRAVPSS